MITTVGIVGAGTMGNGIAQACAVSGHEVVMLDLADAAVARGVATIAGSLERLQKKDKITAADKDAASKAAADRADDRMNRVLIWGISSRLKKAPAEGRRIPAGRFRKRRALSKIDGAGGGGGRAEAQTQSAGRTANLSAIAACRSRRSKATKAMGKRNFSCSTRQAPSWIAGAQKRSSRSWRINSLAGWLGFGRRLKQARGVGSETPQVTRPIA